MIKHAKIIHFFYICLNHRDVQLSKKPMTERSIISMLNAGQFESAFNAIVDSYSERLYWHIRRLLYSHEDADDLLQEVFIKVWRALPAFRGESQLYTWLYRIATNEALNFLRKKNSKVEVDAELADALFGEKIDEDHDFNGNALQRELHKAVNQLPQKQKLVFNLRYFDEMKYEDIARITGTSVGALKASYHHAYTKISEILKKIFIH